MHLVPALAFHKLRSIVFSAGANASGTVALLLASNVYVGDVVFLVVAVVVFALLVLRSTVIVSRAHSECTQTVCRCCFLSFLALLFLYMVHILTCRCLY